MKSVCVAILLVGVLCGVSLAQVVRVGFAYTSPREDVSWTYALENARQTIEQDYPDVFTEWTVIPVPASQTCPAACLANIRDFAARGFDLVVLGGQAFYDVDHIVAAEFYGTKFVQISRVPLVSHEHVAWFSAFIEQVRFLSGVAAGLMTTTNEVGYVTVNRLQPVLRQFNAWYFGVKKVNPTAKVYLISGNAFGNATADRIAAEHILDISNVDVLSFQSLYAEVSRVACERGIYSTGYGSDIRKFVGDSVLTSAMWNWVPALHYFVDKVGADNWDNTTFEGDLTSNSIKLADFSSVVPQSVQDIVNQYKQQVIDGTEMMFCGPQANFLSNGAVPVDGCMNRAQQNAVNKVPSSTIDPNFTDLGNVDLSLPASTPLASCWTPVVVSDPPNKGCVRGVTYSQSVQSSFSVSEVTYSQWAVVVTSPSPLHESMQFKITPSDGSILSVWGASSLGDSVYNLDDWHFSSGLAVLYGSFYYIVSSVHEASISTTNATCTADCRTTVDFTLRSSWASTTTYDQLYEFAFTNIGLAVTESVDMSMNFFNGGFPTGTWNLGTSATSEEIATTGTVAYTVPIGYLAPGQTFSSFSGFILSTPHGSTPQTPTFSVNSFICK